VHGAGARQVQGVLGRRRRLLIERFPWSLGLSRRLNFNLFRGAPWGSHTPPDLRRQAHTGPAAHSGQAEAHPEAGRPGTQQQAGVPPALHPTPLCPTPRGTPCPLPGAPLPSPCAPGPAPLLPQTGGRKAGCDGDAGAVPAVVERVFGARQHRDLRGLQRSRVAPHLALLLSGSPSVAGDHLQAHPAGADSRLPSRRSRRQRRAQRSRRRGGRVDHQQASPGAAVVRPNRAALRVWRDDARCRPGWQRAP
jgi:hypothetical protein